MNASPRIPVLFLLLYAAALTSCANQPQPAPNEKLKLETITRPFGPTTYLYRKVD